MKEDTINQTEVHQIGQVERNGQTNGNEHTALSFGTLFFTDIDPQHFERIGFNCAMALEPKETFKQTLHEIEQWLESYLRAIDGEYNRRKDLIKYNIDNAKKQEEELILRKSQHLEGITSLKIRVNNLRREITSLKSALADKLIEFAQKKEDFFSKATFKIKKELSEITKLYYTQIDERYETEKQIMEKVEAANKYKLEGLYKEHSLFSTHWEKVIKQLSVHGFSIQPMLALAFMSFLLLSGVFSVGLVAIYSNSFLSSLSIIGLATIGLFLAVFVPVLSYFYIRSIVEPRLLVSADGDGDKTHWEFLLFGVLYFFSVSVLAWGAYTPDGVSSSILIIAWLSFVFSTFYILGLFLRIVLLHYYKSRIEKKLHQLNDQIIRLTYPGANDLGNITWAKFKEEFQHKLNLLHDLINKRMQYAFGAYRFSVGGVRLFWWQRVFIIRHFVKVGRFIVRRVRSYLYFPTDGDEVFYRYDRDLLATQDFRIHKWEKMWFPVEIEELRQLRKKIAESELQLHDLSSEYKRQETESTEYCLKLDADIARLKNSIRGYEGELTKLNEAHNRDKSLANQFKIKVLYCLKKGYNFGTWYFGRKYSLGIVPTNDGG